VIFTRLHYEFEPELVLELELEFGGGFRFLNVFLIRLATKSGGQPLELGSMECVEQLAMINGLNGLNNCFAPNVSREKFPDRKYCFMFQLGSK